MHMQKFADLFFHILEIKYISSNAGIMSRSIGFDSYSIELDIGWKRNVDVGKRQNTFCEQGK